MSKNYTNIQKLNNITGSIDDNSDVNLIGLSDGQFLTYSVASGSWLPSSSGNFVALSVNGQAVSTDTHTHTTSNIIHAYQNISTSVDLLPSNDIVFGYCDTNDIILTMPPASGIGGKKVYIKKVSGLYNFSIRAVSGETIDGNNTTTLNYINQSITLISDNFNWFIF